MRVRSQLTPEDAMAEPATEPSSADRDALKSAGPSILITGCSSGIGYAAAHTLAGRGWRVFASCRKLEDCARLEAEGLESPLIDYTDDASIHAAFDHVLEQTGGRLHALFNNGAYALPGALEDLPTDGLRHIFETNFFGWHTLTRRAIPIMRAQGGGRLVQCSSILGFISLKFRGAYQSTKYALEAHTDTLRLELEGSDVEAILIQPGPIDTAIRTNSYAHFKKWIRWDGSAHAEIYPKVEERLTAEVVKSKFELPPEAVVKKLIHALESPRPRARYMVTTPTYVMNVAKRLLGARTLDRMLIRNSY